MNITTIKNAVTSKAGRQLLLTKKHSPHILFGAGVVGVVATAVLAARATLKLEDVLEVTQDNIELSKRVHKSELGYSSDREYQKEITIIYTSSVLKIGKLYAPAFAVGTLSVAALTGSHVMLSKRNLAVTAAYAGLDKAFQEYRARVIDEVGPEKERAFRYATEEREIVVETEEGPQVEKVVRVSNSEGPSANARFFDELCTSWSREPEYNHLFLRCQQNYANDLLRSRGHIFLNEVYDMLGIERSRAGAVVGWIISKDGSNYVDFGIFDGDNPRARDFVNGREGSILLDFNVDGVIYDKF